MRSLKQDLLNEGKVVAASQELGQAYLGVKNLVIAKSKQETDDDIRDYWTMMRGGLVAALGKAEKLLNDLKNPTCNDELAGLLEEFLKNVKR